MERRYITINEFAELLNLSTRTVYRRIKEKTLPFVQIGGKHNTIRIDMEGFEKMRKKEDQA